MEKFTFKNQKGQQPSVNHFFFIPTDLFIRNPDLPPMAGYVYALIYKLSARSEIGCFAKNETLINNLPGDISIRQLQRYINCLIEIDVIERINTYKNKKHLRILLIKQLQTNREWKDKNGTPTTTDSQGGQNCQKGHDKSVGKTRQGCHGLYTSKNTREKNKTTFSYEKDSNVVSDETTGTTGTKSSLYKNGLKRKTKNYNPRKNKNKMNTLASKEKDKLKNKEKKEPHCPKIIQTYFDIWKRFTGKSNRKTSETYRQTIRDLKKLLKGNYYENHKCKETKFLVGKKINPADFELAVSRFAKARTNADYYPQNKKYIAQINLKTFLFNEYGQNETSRSYLAKYLKEEPNKIPSQNQDKYSELTKQIIATYKLKVLGGIKYNPNLLDHNKFISAASLLTEFFNKNKKRLNGLSKSSNKSKAELLFKAVLNDLGENKIKHISPGYFCSEKTFSDRLPRYMYANALINEPFQTVTGGRSRRQPGPLEPGYLDWVKKYGKTASNAM